MNTYDRHDLRRALVMTGLRPGGFVLIHSALFALGRMSDAPIDEIPARLYETIRDLVGPQTTIVVPTFTFDFCKGKGFDRRESPSRGMGSFSEYVRQRPRALRSPHPIQSIAAEGPRAAELCNRDTRTAFEPGSCFDFLVENDAQILMLGCGGEAISLVHWTEEREQVPYRYFKDFTGTYRDLDGHRSERTYTLYARDLSLNPKVRLAPITTRLKENGQLIAVPFGHASIDLCRARHFTAVASRLLRNDPYALLESRPHGHRSSL